jgi:ATP-dependent Lon protease
LVTGNNEEYIEDSKNAFRNMAMSLEPAGVMLTFEFDESGHDRAIILDNGWKIVLGRGLDIWQKTGGWFDLAEYAQDKRLCKGCEVSYLEVKSEK